MPRDSPMRWHRAANPVTVSSRTNATGTFIPDSKDNLFPFSFFLFPFPIDEKVFLFRDLINKPVYNSPFTIYHSLSPSLFSLTILSAFYLMEFRVHLLPSELYRFFLPLR